MNTLKEKYDGKKSTLARSDERQGCTTKEIAEIMSAGGRLCMFVFDAPAVKE